MAGHAQGALARPSLPAPVVWLARFRDVGGWWLIGSDDRAWIGMRAAQATEAGHG
jgi:hypothetical protein